VKKRMLVSSIAVAMLAAGQAQAELAFNAALELDTDMVDTASTDNTFTQGGFVELGASGMHTRGDYFVSGAGVIRLLKSGDTAIQDAYLKFGNQTWDIQAGRFEATNLFPLGQDTVVAHAGDGSAEVYEANLVRGRAGDNGGQIALHLNASENLKFELATIFGDADVAGDNGEAVSGVRPVITWAGESVTVSAGYETLSYDLTAGGEVDRSGFGVTAGFAMGDATVNLNAAHSEDEVADKEVMSYGANIVYGGFGAGFIQSETELAAGADPEVTTLYASYKMPLLDIENAFVTVAASVSDAENAGADDEKTALRLRLNYTF